MRTLAALLIFIAAACAAPETPKVWTVLAIAPVAGPDGTVAVTCWLHDTDETRERQWDPLVQVAPVLGERWLCP